jgi:serpin B
MTRTHNIITLTLIAAMLLVATPSQARVDGQYVGSLLADANNAFGWDMLDALIDGNEDLADGNLVFSPASIHLALLMTRSGAAGNTLTQFDDVLVLDSVEATGCCGEPLDMNTISSILLSHLNASSTGNDDLQLTIGNSIWAQEGYEWDADFMAGLESNYGAPLNMVDFINGDLAEIADDINAHVASETNDLIDAIVSEDTFTELTRMALVNTVYFKAPWANEFSDNYTRAGDFTVSADETIDAEMMRQNESFNYVANDTAALLEMPYEGGEVSMVIILPNEVDGLGDTRAWLSEGNLDEALESMESEYIAVSIPKFKMATDLKLGEILAAMGLEDAFSDTAADFSGMSPDAVDDGLHIDKVLHQAVIDVNEDGTEAAAATVVIMGVRGVPPTPQVSFTADHPFLFVIRHNATGEILFAGQVVRPEYPEADSDTE